MSAISSDQLRLSSHEPLAGLEKQLCTGCGRRRMYFCYDCRKMLPGISYPQVPLTSRVDIIKHPMEKNSKSTAIHCLLAAPSQTTIYDISNVPDYKTQHKDENVVLVFPSPEAESIEHYVKEHGQIDRFVFLDCTWFQVGTMQKIPEIQGLPCIHLKNYKTIFWRPQHNLDDHHLATIEAIYFALVEHHHASKQTQYAGEFDDLLYWFVLMRGKFDAREEEYFRKKALEEAM